MRIGALYNRHKDDTVYIIGTGPSLRCTPLSFFADKVTIGLNQAWRHLPTTYSVTVHPELVLDYQAANHAAKTQWVVKKKAPMENLELSDPNYYVFGTSYDILAVTSRPEDTLYLGEGVQTVAMDLAARMGASFVVLVGCDARMLGGEFHAHNQHVRWLGMRPKDQYKAYRDTTAGVRTALRHLGVGVLSLSPFIGLDAAEEDYARLRVELKLPALPKPKDTSPYTRNPKEVRTAAKAPHKPRPKVRKPPPKPPRKK